jgi:addiction module HigA family antidote
MLMRRMHNPPQPSEVLREWLDGISATDAAAHLGVARVSLSRLLNGASGISAEMDLRLAQALGTTPGSWLSMQMKYDLWQAQKRFRAKVRPLKVPESGAARGLSDRLGRLRHCQKTTLCPKNPHCATWLIRTT